MATVSACAELTIVSKAAPPTFSGRKLIMATPGEVLDDLDSFLDRLSEEEDKEDEEEDGDFQFLVGEACHECRVEENPAMAALQGDHIACLREILRVNEEEAIAGVSSGNGATLAHVAARRGDVEALKLLVTKSPSLCTSGDIRGATPLHVAAYRGHEECLAALLDAGGTADQPDTDGATAVHFAAASGHLEAIKTLISRGRGNANARNSSGETPGIILQLFLVSVCFTFYTVLSLAVYFAAQEGHLACIQWLVEQAGADPQLASTDGMTPLHAAAQTGRLNVTYWLVRSANCSISCRTSDGATPVHFAAAKGFARDSAIVYTSL